MGKRLFTWAAAWDLFHAETGTDPLRAKILFRQRAALRGLVIVVGIFAIILLFAVVVGENTLTVSTLTF